MRPVVARVAAIVAASTCLAVCGGGSTAPSAVPLPLALEGAHFKYFYAAGDHVDSDWEEVFHAWATGQIGVVVPQKISYYKYTSRQNMGDHTGTYNANAFALPDKLEIHTLWSTDRHEVIHIYTSLVGRPSNFFNEGIAVAFQMDPVAGDFVARFNGEAVHDSCRQYLQAGSLVLPLDRVVSGMGWNTIADATLAYREAGSFMRFTIDRYSLPAVLQFFRASTATDDLATVKSRFAGTVGVTLDQVEQEWLSFLRS